MTKAAKIWSAIICAILLGITVVIGVGIFMAATLRSLQDQQKFQTNTLKRLDAAEISAQKDRDVLLASNNNVQAVVDCIVGRPPVETMADCVRRRINELNLQQAP